MYALACWSMTGLPGTEGTSVSSAEILVVPVRSGRRRNSSPTGRRACHCLQPRPGCARPPAGDSGRHGCRRRTGWLSLIKTPEFRPPARGPTWPPVHGTARISGCRRDRFVKSHDHDAARPACEEARRSEPGKELPAFPLRQFGGPASRGARDGCGSRFRFPRWTTLPPDRREKAAPSGTGLLPDALSLEVQWVRRGGQASGYAIW